MTSHNITLPSDLSSLVTDKVESWKYASVSEVIRSYIRLGNQVEKQQEMRDMQMNLIINKAEKDFKEGNYIAFNSLDDMSDFLMQSAQEVIEKA